MVGINHWIVVGRVAQDARFNRTDNGTPMLSFTMTVERRGRERQADALAVLVFGRVAETLAQGGLVRKDAVCLVVGHAQIDEWQSRQGVRQVRLLCIANHVQVLQPSAERDGPAPENHLDLEERA